MRKAEVVYVEPILPSYMQNIDQIQDNFDDDDLKISEEEELLGEFVITLQRNLDGQYELLE